MPAEYHNAGQKSRGGEKFSGDTGVDQCLCDIKNYINAQYFPRNLTPERNTIFLSEPTYL